MLADIDQLDDIDVILYDQEAMEKARANLIPFCNFTDANYRDNWHHRIIAAAFERFVRGTCPPIQIICAPPGTGKSHIVSRAGPAWGIGNDPSLFFALGSYSADLAEAHTQDCFNITASQEFRELFPDVLIGRTAGTDGKFRSQAKEWRTHKGGGYKGVGRTGSITGKHPNRFIVDDPIKDQEEADSPTIRQKVWEWFLNVVMKRMGAHGRILLMLTRWHPDDIVGRLQKLKKDHPEAVNFELIMLPGRMDDLATKHPEDPRKLGETLWPWYYAGGKPGSVIPEPGAIPEGHPDGMTAKEMDQKARAFLRTSEVTNPAGFMAQEQQQPAPKSAYGAHAYHNYGPWNWVEKHAFDPRKPVYIAMDFNYSPMSSILLQPIIITGKKAVIAFQANAFENCSTGAACERIIEQLLELTKKAMPFATQKAIEEAANNIRIIVYPDPACQARTAHGDSGESDLAIIKQKFKNHKGGFWVKVRDAHPKRKDRLNAVNNVLKSDKTGETTLFIVKSTCEPLIRDFNECGMEEFLNAHFSASYLGHASDALGYFVDMEFPIKNTTSYFTGT